MSRNEPIAVRLRPVLLVAIMLGVAATVGDVTLGVRPGGAGPESGQLPGSAGADGVLRSAIADCPKSREDRTSAGRDVLLRL